MVHRGRGANKFRGGGDASGRGGSGGGRGYRGGGGRGRGGGGRGAPFRLGDEHHSFSLADEAKNTERHHGNYARGSLRHVKISFVAAGHLEPADLLKPLNVNIPPVEEGQNLMQLRAQQTTSDSTEAEEEEEDEDVDMNGQSDSPAEPTAIGDLQEDLDMEKLDLNPPAQSFVVDVVGDPSLKPKGKSLFTMPMYSPAREISPERPGSSSSCSSERIVFIPRNRRPGLSRTGTNFSIPQEPASPAPQKKSPTPPKREPIPPPKEPTPPATEAKAVETVASHTTITTVNEKIPAAPTIDSKPFTRSTKGNKRRSARQRKKEEEEVIRDYIENVAATMRAEEAEDRGEAAPAFSMRELGGEDDGNDPEDAWSSATDSEEEAEDSDAVNAYKSIWSEHELEDLDALSTASEGPRGPVKIVIGKRKRPSGVQYLIRWEGYETDDATWVLAEKLDSTADEKIAMYEKVLIQKATDAANAAASSEDSDDDDDDDYDEDDDEDPDEDEKLARFLQHQEEIGITESDLELNLELDELMELSFPGGGVGSGSKKKGKGKGKARYGDIVLDRRTGRFPSATRFANAFDDLDLMDWERPSLSVKKGKKGKGKQLQNLGLSDPEMEENMRQAWEKDRQKKKSRKKEREALRAEGLLGSKRNGHDLKAKWTEGMSKNEIKNEIRQFMNSELSSMAFPPMSKPERARVHTIAAGFGLKSKSTGGSRSRYTTLYKTPDFGAHTSRGGRGRGRGGAGRGGAGRGGASRGGAGGAAHHREGDIVGGSAPEIAEDNKGRRMLEKMGYRTGMALGIDGNKGIVVPVAAVVKISKAGLG